MSASAAVHCVLASEDRPALESASAKEDRNTARSRCQPGSASSRATSGAMSRIAVSNASLHGSRCPSVRRAEPVFHQSTARNPVRGNRFLLRRRVPGVRRGSQCPRLVQERRARSGPAAGQRHVTLSLEGDRQIPRGIAAARVACEPLPPASSNRPVEERPGAADVVELQHRVAQTLERNRQVAAVVDAGLVARVDPLEEHQRALEVGNGPGPVAGHGVLHLRLPRQRVSEVA